MFSFAMLVAVFVLHGWSYETLSALLIALLLFGLLRASVDLLFQRETFQKKIPNPGVVKFFINALLLIFISKVLPSFALDKTSTAFWASFVIVFVLSLLKFKPSQKETAPLQKSPTIKEARARVISSDEKNPS
ncbi:MAG: phage holin family protein [Chthoniobacterales bacterium]|nr:phage holin family protein [Chthoniobacterales bacterium]